MKTNAPQKNIPIGWEKKQIKDLLDYERPDKYIVESDQYLKQGIPVLTANKSFVLGYTDESGGVYKSIPAIIFDDFTTDSKFVEFPFKVKSSAIKILKEKSSNIDLRFVFEKMKSINFPTGTHKRYYISQYQDMEVLVPPLSEQKKIAEILRAVDEYIKKTEEIIIATKKLKKGLMRRSFSLENEGQEFEVIKLKDVSKISSGKTPSRSKKEYYIDGTVPWVKSTEIKFNFVSDTSEKITKRAVEEAKMKIHPKGAVLIAMYGQGITRGRSAILDCEATTNQAVASVVTNPEKLINLYLFYWLFFQYDYLRNLGHGGNQKNLNSEILKQLEIPIPSLSKQKRIIEILKSLDKKEDINHKIKAGLIQLKKGLSQDLLSGKKRTV